MNAGADRRPTAAQMIETLSTGGAEHLAVQIANTLAERGFPSHLYVLFGPGPLADRVDPRVKVRYFHHQRSSVRSPSFLPSVLAGYRKLREAIREDEVRVIQSHLPGANFWGLLLAMRGVCAVVPTVHNTREFDYGDADNPLRASLRRRAYLTMLRRCPAMVAVSAQSRLALLKEVGARGPVAEKLIAVPNGVSVPEPLTAGERADLRQSFDCDETTLLLLAAGRHNRQKNFGDLVEAAGRLPATLPDWRLVIAGDGPQRPALKSRAEGLGLQDRVVFPGVVARLDRLMSAADIFVLPSLWEGLPLVLLEAMAAGLPVVGTRIDGISEVVADGESAVLAEPGDIDALAAALGGLMASSELRMRLAESARRHVRDEYSLERVVDALTEIYLQVD